MKLQITGVITTIFLMNNVFASDGEALYGQLCASCHTPNASVKIAPPIFAVVDHVRQAYPQREDFIAQIIEWVDEPKEEVALMPGAIRKFNLMPKLGYSQNDVKEIAEYLFDKDTVLSKEYKEHKKKGHGSN
ncbi:MAG: cytochrome c [Candidatus Thioglobus sp.]|uniref:c-type cytochrome n=1 Tax=Candidatus Thioglobus sp. TaxID=2026721 RepID=UPI0030AF72F3